MSGGGAGGPSVVRAAMAFSEIRRAAMIITSPRSSERRRRSLLGVCFSGHSCRLMFNDLIVSFKAVFFFFFLFFSEFTYIPESPG